MQVHRIFMPTPVARLVDLRTLARELCMSGEQVHAWLAGLGVPIIQVGPVETYYMPALDVRLYEHGMGRPFDLADWREIATVYAGLRRSNLLSVLRTIGDAFVGDLDRAGKRRQASRRAVRRRRPLAPGVLRLHGSGRQSGRDGLESPGGATDHCPPGADGSQGDGADRRDGLPAQAYEGGGAATRPDPERTDHPLEGPGGGPTSQTGSEPTTASGDGGRVLGDGACVAGPGAHYA